MWAETANTATDHEVIIVYPGESMSSFEKFFEKEAPYARCLRAFGEIAIIKDHEKIKEKLTDRGKVAMFLGYPKSSSTETFRFLNLKTMKTGLSRDVIWINKNYGSWKGLTSSNTTPLDDDDEEEEEEEAAVTADHKIIDTPNDTATQEQRATRELRKLQFTSGGGNPTANMELNRLSNQKNIKKQEGKWLRQPLMF